MRENDVVSKEYLDGEGWTLITPFGNCYVYGKDRSRVMWNPITGKIVLVYLNNNNF